MSFLTKLNLVLAVVVILAWLWVAIAWSKEKPLGAIEPTLLASRQVERDIVEGEAKVAEDQKQLLAALASAVDTFDPKQFGTMDAVVQDMRPAVRQLHKVAAQLLGRQDGYAADLQSLRKTVTRAPDVYRAASGAFKEYAEKESFAEIKEDYSNLSEIWRLMAEQMERHGQIVVGEEKELEQFGKYLEHTTLFLERLDQHLDSLPKILGEEERANHIARMTRFAEGLEGLRSALRAFHKKLGSATSANTDESNAGQPAVTATSAVAMAPGPVSASLPSQHPAPRPIQVTPTQVKTLAPAISGATNRH